MPWGGGGEEERKGPRRAGVGGQAGEVGCTCVHQPCPGRCGEAGGKEHSADGLVGSAWGQATMPANAAILLGFRKGNVQFISHRPVQTGQPLDGSDPTGILVTSGCLLWPPNCGCSHSQRQKKSLFPALCGFPEAAGRLVRAEGFRRF